MKNKQGNDRYAERGMNTFNEPQKCKLIQTTKIGYTVSTFVTPASTWTVDIKAWYVGPFICPYVYASQLSGRGPTDVDDAPAPTS